MRAPRSRLNLTGREEPGTINVNGSVHRADRSQDLTHINHRTVRGTLLPDRTALGHYVADGRRTALAAERDRAITRTDVIQVELIETL